MHLLHYSAILTGLCLMSPSVQADTIIECGGYAPKINDHVEWKITITKASADFGGMNFKVSETKRFFILIGPHSQIRINKDKKSYVIFGAKGPNGPAIEWSRRISGEGCDISN